MGGPTHGAPAHNPRRRSKHGAAPRWQAPPTGAATARACMRACMLASDVGIQDLWLANGLNASLDINCSAAAPAGADTRTYTHTLERARALARSNLSVSRANARRGRPREVKGPLGAPVRRFPRSGAQPLAHCRDDVQIPRELLDDLARAARACELRHLLEHVRVLGDPRGFNRWFLF